MALAAVAVDLELEVPVVAVDLEWEVPVVVVVMFGYVYFTFVFYKSIVVIIYSGACRKKVFTSRCSFWKTILSTKKI